MTLVFESTEELENECAGPISDADLAKMLLWCPHCYSDMEQQNHKLSCKACGYVINFAE